MKAAEFVRDGNRVLVFCNPSYHVGSSIAAKSFEHPDIVRAFHDGQFQALRLDYDNWQGQEIRNIFQQHGHTKHPMVFLYNADGTVQRLETYSADDAVTHLGIPIRSTMPGWPYAAGLGILLIAAVWRSRIHTDDGPQSIGTRLAYATEQTDEPEPE